MGALPPRPRLADRNVTEVLIAKDREGLFATRPGFASLGGSVVARIFTSCGAGAGHFYVQDQAGAISKDSPRIVARLVERWRAPRRIREPPRARGKLSRAAALRSPAVTIDTGSAAATVIEVSAATDQAAGAGAYPRRGRAVDPPARADNYGERAVDASMS